jgi:hypothetical protein
MKLDIGELLLLDSILWSLRENWRDGKSQIELSYEDFDKLRKVHLRLSQLYIEETL